MSVTVVHAAGSWREIGRTYGEHLRAGIERSLGAYGELAPKLGGELPELRRRLAPYAAAARVHAPARFAEVEGMAEGANLALDEAVLLNCIEELSAIEACTTAGKGRFLAHAEMWYAGQTEIAVLVARPERSPTTVTASCVGFLTGVGASASGFAQGVQSTFAADERPGVPRVMRSRDALCADGPSRAIDAACRPHRAGGYGYVISTAGRHRILETSATRAALLDEGPLAVHTNHYRSSLEAIAARMGPDSHVRLAAAEAALRDAELESLEDCQALLATPGFHPCEGGESATVFGLACDLETGALCVSDGEPRNGRWTSLSVPGFRADL